MILPNQYALAKLNLKAALADLEKAKEDTIKAGFSRLYLSTEHIGFCEKLGFKYIGQGYHPWEDESRIYEIEVKT